MVRVLLGLAMLSAVIAVLVWRDDVPVPRCNVDLAWATAQR